MFCTRCNRNVEPEEHDGSYVCTGCGLVLGPILVNEEGNPLDSVGGSGDYGEEQNPDEKETGD